MPREDRYCLVSETGEPYDYNTPDPEGLDASRIQWPFEETIGLRGPIRRARGKR